MPSVFTLFDSLGALPAQVTPFNGLMASIDPQLLFLDTFDGASIDTTNRWTSGGTVAPVILNGLAFFNVGTTASASSFLSSQASFPPSGFQAFGSVVLIEAGAIVTGNHRFIGLGTQPGSWTALTPLQDAIGVEIDTAGAVRASVYSAGVRIATQVISYPGDGGPHVIIFRFQPGINFFAFDFSAGGTQQIAATLQGAPTQNILPVRAHSINGTSTLSASPTFGITTTALTDYTHPSQAICDGNFPWRKQTVTPRGDAIISLYDGFKSSYSTSAVAVANVAGDTLVISGSATKTIRVTRISVTSTQTTGGDIDVIVIKRSTADTGGTSTALLAAPHDSTNAAPTAVVLLYSVAPTTGTSVGTVRASKLSAPAATANTVITVWDFGNGPKQGMVLRGIAQQLCVNFSAVLTGGSSDIDIEWTEE